MMVGFYIPHAHSLPEQIIIKTWPLTNNHSPAIHFAPLLRGKRFDIIAIFLQLNKSEAIAVILFFTHHIFTN